MSLHWRDSFSKLAGYPSPHGILPPQRTDDGVGLPGDTA
jgi:hypothetical protein